MKEEDKSLDAVQALVKRFGASILYGISDRFSLKPGEDADINSVITTVESMLQQAKGQAERRKDERLREGLLTHISSTAESLKEFKEHFFETLKTASSMRIFCDREYEKEFVNSYERLIDQLHDLTRSAFMLGLFVDHIDAKLTYEQDTIRGAKARNATRQGAQMTNITKAERRQWARGYIKKRDAELKGCNATYASLSAAKRAKIILAEGPTAHGRPIPERTILEELRNLRSR